jgi:hypothetical protein
MDNTLEERNLPVYGFVWGSKMNYLISICARGWFVDVQYQLKYLNFKQSKQEIDPFFRC